MRFLNLNTVRLLDLASQEMGRSDKIVHYQRRSLPTGNFSLEFIFADIRRRLKGRANIELRNAPFYSSGLFKRIGILIDAFLCRTQILHVAGDITFAGILIGKPKVVLTILDCVVLSRSRGIKFAIFKFFWMTLPMRRADVITTISESAKNEILKYMSPQSFKIEVVYPSISEDFVFSPKEFNAQCPTILLIGTTPNKNLPRVIEACGGISCRLKIVGSLSDEIRLQLEAKKIQYSNHVSLPFQEIIASYVDADLVMFASTYEGFGMPIIEAQRTGRPVITSRFGAMSEVAGDAAILVDPFDVDDIRKGLMKVIQSPELRHELIEKGQKNAKRFEPSVVADQFLQIYKSLF